MSKIWVVVAESSRAKIFSTDRVTGKLQEVNDLVHAESRLHEQAITSDLPGSGFDGKGGHHHMEESTSPKEHEAEVFAKQVAEVLENGRNTGSYEQIVLVAAPHFLGLLRNELSNSAQQLISHELDKNLAQHSIDSIEQHLQQSFTK